MEKLLFIGIMLMAVSTVLAFIAVIVLWLYGKRLKLHLEQEFGKKRHD